MCLSDEFIVSPNSHLVDYAACHRKKLSGSETRINNSLSCIACLFMAYFGSNKIEQLGILISTLKSKTWT